MIPLKAPASNCYNRNRRPINSSFLKNNTSLSSYVVSYAGTRISKRVVVQPDTDLADQI